MKPLIGLPAQRIADEDWKSPVQGQRENYVDAVIAAGGIPVVIPLIESEELLHELYERLDGVLLCGGGDVSPRWYGHPPDQTNYGIDLDRDRLELQLARWAMADGKPLLGICRGSQIINVACGGSLIADVPAAWPSRVDHRACRTHERMNYLEHGLRLESESRLARILGATQLRVNSLHHEVVDRIGHNLRVVGWAEDGLPEAIEGPGFTFGVQFHPEALYNESGLPWLRLFEALVRAAERPAAAISAI